MEDGDGAEILLAEPRGELLGDDDRAVIATRATDPDGQPGLALRDVRRDRERQELLEELEEPRRDGLAEDECADLVGESGQWAQIRVVEGVLHESDVEDEVGLEGHAVLEAEADELERELVGADVRGQLREEPLTQLPERELGRVENDVRFGTHGFEPTPFLGDRIGDAPGLAERVAMAGLAEPADEDIVARLEEDDSRPDAASLERTAHRG